ncbi:MAG TPA: sugar phosphate isomerase/epimerase family protein [Acidobacteriota bacterium]|jgi:sugar phosphate isomerase/epimerase|nr:sugar phosphate isomerase/epimerase family protein [Acidobacteriota bacterium]HRV08552.1 sugar phosphate isomerase/epimerase family protein [Acidobacteriota bacterium]
MKETRSIHRRDFAKSVGMAAAAAGIRTAAEAQAPADIKLGLYSITYLGLWYAGEALTLEQVVERARKFGYHGVEIDGKRPHGNPLDMPPNRCRELRKFAEDRGVEIYAVAANNDFSSPIPEFRESQLVYVRELIRMAADLQAPVLRVFLAWPGVTVLPEGGARYDLAKSIWEFTHKEFTPQQTWEWCRSGMKEAAKYAGDHGITLALQNHAPVIGDYRDMLRMIREVDSPYLKACFDTRLEYGKRGQYLLDATREVGDLQVLTHFGDEFTRMDGKIVPKEDEFLADQVAGLLEIGYRGYMGYELCHPLPRTEGRLPGIDFVDRNVELAAEYWRETMAKVKKDRG